MDTIMDICSRDQCVIVLRYVGVDSEIGDIKVQERIYELKHVTTTTGLHLFNTLKDSFVENEILLENCIADSFDGAANMSGQYHGVTTHIREMLPSHMHTWCYAHVLNLVITDTVQCSTSIITFFNALQERCVFFKDSYKRLAVYKDCKIEEGKVPLQLKATGATRWRSKNDAAVKIFGHFDIWLLDDQKAQQSRKKYCFFVL